MPGIRSRALLLTLVALLGGCTETTTDPSADIDAEAVGVWLSRAQATNESGEVICEFTSIRMELGSDGRYVYDEFDLESLPPAPPCTTLPRPRATGSWRVAEEGMLVFIPAFWDGSPSGEIAYSVEGGSLGLGLLTLAREAG